MAAEHRPLWQGSSLRHVLAMVVAAGTLLAAERVLTEQRTSEGTPPSFVLYAQVVEAPDASISGFGSLTDAADPFEDLDAGIAASQPLELRVRWVFTAPSEGTGASPSRSILVVLLQLGGLILLGVVLRRLAGMRQPLDARLRPTPSLPAFFTCCALAALLPQLMLLRHEYGSSSSLAIAVAATLVYSAAWMATRRLQLLRVLGRTRSLTRARIGELIFEPLRLLRLDGDLVRLSGEHYERAALVEFADGRRGRVELEEAELDGDACAEVVRLSQRAGGDERVWVAAVLDEKTASAEAAEPLCREVATERRLSGPLLLVGSDLQALRHQLACELLILSSVATLGAAFLLSRAH